MAFRGKLKDSARSGASYAKLAAAYEKDAEDRRVEVQTKADKKTKADLIKAEEAKKPKNWFDAIVNEGGDILGTAAKNLTKFGADVVNDVSTGFNKDEAAKRTKDFMKTSGAEKWDERQSASGDIVGGLLGGIPSSFYDTGKEGGRNIYNTTTALSQNAKGNDAMQALENWKKDPKLMAKTLKPGETREQKIQQLNDIIKQNNNTNEQKAFQEIDPLKAAGNAAMNVINVGTFGTGGKVLKVGEKLLGIGEKGATNVVQKALTSTSIPARGVAGAGLGTGALAANTAVTGEAPDGKDIGVAIATGFLPEVLMGIKAKRAAAKKPAETAGKTPEEVKAIENKPLMIEALSGDTKTKLGKQVTDLNESLNKVNSNDINYMRENDLLSTEAGDKRYKELTTENPEFVKTQQEAAKVAQDADAQVKHYNDLKTGSPYFRQVDTIESARKAELDRLQTMADDPSIPANADDMQSLVKDVNTKWDEKIAKLDEKYPQEASERPIMDQAIQEATRAKLDAEQNLQDVTNNAYQAAFKEANSISETPDKAKIVAHKQAIIDQLDDINTQLEAAQSRADAPTVDTTSVDKQIKDMQDGTAPIMRNGTNAEKKAEFKRLQTQKQDITNNETTKTALQDPSQPLEGVVAENVAVDTGKALQMPTKDINNLTQLVSTPWRTLERIGMTDLSTKVRDAFDGFRRGFNKSERTLSQLSDTWNPNKESRVRVSDALNGKEVNLTATETNVVVTLRQFFKDYAERVGLPEEARIQDYFPHMYENGYDTALGRKLTGELDSIKADIEAGKLKGDSLTKALKRSTKIEGRLNEMDKAKVTPIELQELFNKKFLAKTKAGNIDNSRLLKEDDAFIKDPIRVALAYARQAERRINMQPAFDEMNKYLGTRDLDTHIKDYITNLGHAMKGGSYAIDDQFNKIADSIVNMVPGVKINDAYSKGSRLVRNNAYRANLQMNVGTAMRNISQATNTIGEVGFGRWIEGATGTMKMLANKQYKGIDLDELHDMGVFDDMFGNIGNDMTGAAKVLKHLDKAGWAMMRFTETVNRGSAYIGAKRQFIARNSGKLSGEALEAAAKRHAAEAVGKTQFHFNEVEMPPILRSETAKNALQYQSFNIKQAEFLADIFGGSAKEIHSILKGQKITRKDLENTFKALRYSAAVGTMAGSIGGLLGMSISDFIPDPTNPKNYGGSPAFQLLVGDGKTKDGILDIFMNSSTNKYYDDQGNEIKDRGGRAAATAGNFFENTLVPNTVPWFTQAKKTYDANAMLDVGYDQTDKGSVKYLANDPNNVDTRVRASLFGKSSLPENQQYYDNGETPLTKSQSEDIKVQPEQLRKQWYDYFRAADKITNRTDVNAEITQLYQDGEVEKARRKAKEFNNMVDEKMASFYNRYDSIDPDLQEKLDSKLHIKITSRSETARAN